MSSNPPVRDRRQLLEAAGATLNGIDFVDVTTDQTQLYVHFLNQVAMAGTLSGATPVTITGGEVVSTVLVEPIDETSAWSTDDEGRPVLALSVTAPGDFSTYTLQVSSTVLDPYFDQAPCNFKANCPTTMDCATPTPVCPPPAEEQVPIDYLAKDYGSFRKALSDFSISRYPDWMERSEADLGMVLMEALSAMADELSYYQDGVAAESTIETATQRLSVLRHARLVDYEPAPPTVATTVLQLDVASTGSGSWTITTPLRCFAIGADGLQVDFEIEDPDSGLGGTINFDVDARWNRTGLSPYYWDDSQRCLLVGSTVLSLVGHGLGLYPDQQLLLDSPAADSADPPVRELVVVASASETTDPLYDVLLTRVLLSAPTVFEHDLFDTAVAGNIVPAVQGARTSETFLIPGGTPVPTPTPPAPVVVRLGANWTPEDPTPDYRYCLASAPLAWLATPTQAEDTTIPAQPEVVLSELTTGGGTGAPWEFERWLLDADGEAKEFTLTPEQYSPVLTSNGTTWFDYDGDGGTTVRFGDGTFGMVPLPGTVFGLTYRVGGGTVGNVPADTIAYVPGGQPQGSIVSTCTNPFPAAGGQDGETIAQVRTRAPQAFHQPLRVVLPSDYVAAAQSLPWVQQAGTTFRWTGSWLTVFTSADPVATEEPTVDELESLTELLDRRRLAGYESYVLPPRYVSLDLRITVCGLPTYFAGDVEMSVLAALQPGALPVGGVGFFDHSRWGFGQPLESSALLAAIQACLGVEGVYAVVYRQRGVTPDWTALPETLTFAADQILRVDNDPSRPDAGSLHVTVDGAK